MNSQTSYLMGYPDILILWRKETIIFEDYSFEVDKIMLKNKFYNYNL